MNTIILNAGIAGYHIRINLRPADNQELREHMHRYLRMYLKGFLQEAKTQNTDFTVDVVPSEATLLTGRNHSAYVKLFSKKPPKTFITYYSISTTQLQLILTQALVSLLDRNGCLIRCSAVQARNGALLFFGPPGAGQSTAAMLLSSKYRFLADDLGVIREEDSGYNFYQVPSTNTKVAMTKLGKGYPLRAACFLSKSDRYAFEKLPQGTLLQKKLAAQHAGDMGKNNLKTQFLIRMATRFDRYFTLYFGTDPAKLDSVIRNIPA